MVEINKVTKAWVAGFFDGEGTLTIHKTGYTLHCSISQTDKPILDYIQPIWGGNFCVSDRPGNTGLHKPLWRLFWPEAEAYKLIVDLLPYIKLKKPAFELAKSFIERVRDYRSLRGGAGLKGQPKMTGIERQYRKQAYEAMRLLQSRTKK